MTTRVNVLQTIGDTPLVQLCRLPKPDRGEIYGKLESANPSGSVKDRVAQAVVEAAEAEGKLSPGGTIVFASGGNSGISLAFVAAVRGYKMVVIMPEDSNAVRMGLLQRYGAEIRVAPALQGMEGAMEVARELAAANPEWFMPDLFNSPIVVAVHRRATGQEILRQTEGRIDAFVAGVGTGGTLTGVAQALKEAVPALVVAAVEPAGSPLLSAGWAGVHHIAGIGANFIPPNLDRRVIDRVFTVSDADAFKVMTQLAREEGLLVGPSSGACAHAALRLADELGPGSRVVAILADSGDRYLNVGG